MKRHPRDAVRKRRTERTSQHVPTPEEVERAIRQPGPIGHPAEKGVPQAAPKVKSKRDRPRT